ncbi:unnamed protein product [Lactuca virosa]|uniref:Uncharacterized protein n=1 Tax=Lactuca virosa TaxID=75947 RepID=A0AAU9P0U4_9ASTR|nr:unnamed protein product [Lactuca virosa]
MACGATTDRVADPSPDLTPEEQITADLLSENYVKWNNVDKKLHPSSIRATLRSKSKVVGEEVVSLEGVMNRLDKVIDLPSRKFKRTTHGNELKSHGLPSSGGQSSSKEPASEEAATTNLHECPVVTDLDLKHAKENVPPSKAEFLSLMLLHFRP